ncbi:hypothetical protein VZT92_005767 [Zoarces viviparus]|uniref:Uncharacterized protein n=1 Tax=Zoarces viviparus TaxID=48416 RepID=A0AAW1FQK4_ZOAVI
MAWCDMETDRGPLGVYRFSGTLIWEKSEWMKPASAQGLLTYSAGCPALALALALSVWIDGATCWAPAARNVQAWQLI